MMMGTALVFGFVLFTGCKSADSGLAGPFEQFSPHQGEVLVVLMGKPDCPGTEKGMRFFTRFQRTLSEGVAYLRVDVPPPGGSLKKEVEPNPGIHYMVDRDRDLAEKLNFFYYPTLFILDREGYVRYRGGVDEKRTPEIISKLLAEQPGTAKTAFTDPVLQVGQKLEGFTGSSLSGGQLSYKGLRGKEGTLLIFSAMSCPFSKKAVVKAPEILSKFNDQGISVVIINEDESAEAQAFYRDNTPGIPVLADPDRRIGGSQFGVQTVPFFFVMDKDDMVAYRMPFTGEVAVQAVEGILGLGPGPSRVQKAGAG
jgi:peroxiredoxin